MICYSYLNFSVQLIGRSGDFAGFFIQARAEHDQGSVTSIVGTWRPMNSEAKTARCNQVDGVSWLVFVCCLYTTTLRISPAKVNIIQNLFQWCWHVV